MKLLTNHEKRYIKNTSAKSIRVGTRKIFVSEKDATEEYILAIRKDAKKRAEHFLVKPSVNRHRLVAQVALTPVPFGLNRRTFVS